MARDEIEFEIGQTYEDEKGELWKCLETIVPKTEEYPILLMGKNDGMLAAVNAQGYGELLGMERKIKIVRHYVYRRELYIDYDENKGYGHAYGTLEEAYNAGIRKPTRFIEADWPCGDK